MPDVLTTARRELGIREDPPESNRVKYNDWYYGRAVSGNAYPWCMAFVQWVFAQSGRPLPYKTASCSALLTWYRKNKPECIVKDPRPGDIIIYTFRHTGIVESVGTSTVTAIEGNTSAGNSGSQSNGGGVFRRTRGRSLVKAFIRPFEPEKEEEDDMDQGKFNQMFEEALTAHRKKLQDNDARSYSAEARAWAVARGLIQGGGKLPDGSDNYMWEDLLTREQMATLLYRFALIMGKV